MEGYEKILVDKGVDPTLLALMNDKEDDYFKWIILLGILRGGFFGDEGRKAADDVLLQGQTNIKDALTACCNAIQNSQNVNNQSNRDGQAGILQAIQNAAAAAAQCCCETKGAVSQSQSVTQADGAATRQAVCNAQNDLAAAIASTAADQARCCCETQRLVESTSCDTQRSIDKCCCDTQGTVRDCSTSVQNFLLGETNRLQDRLDTTTQQLSDISRQNAENAALASRERCMQDNLVQQGFAQTDRSICDQTNVLTAQSVANTQRVLDGQQRIVDLISNNRLEQLQAENTQLKTEALIANQTQAITNACGCCNGMNNHPWPPWCHGHHHGGGRHGGGNGGGPPGPP